ncbi:MAG: TolC family protein [Bacteroidetes bacterium]|nr:TolC family protein [Bacteroidota bacterium]
MNKYCSICCILLLCLGSKQGTAQERLTLEDAIARAMKKNYDIGIADLSAQQARRNNTLGNAGFAPSITANGTLSANWNNVYSQLSNGNVQSNPNGQNTNFNPNIGIVWTLFDGGRMFLTKGQLSELAVIGEVQLKLQVQTIVSRTIQMYAQALLQQKQLVAIDTALALASVRMKITQVKYETGAGAKVDYLQAIVDYNSRRSDSLTQVAATATAYDSLSVLMGESEGQMYQLDDTMVLHTDLEPVDYKRLEELNLWVEYYKRNADVSKINSRIAKTYFLPDLTFTGGYGYTRSTSATGFALYSRNYGPNAVLNLSVPLFEGGNIRRQAKVASLQAMKDELLYEKQNTVIRRQYRTAWRNYEVSVAAYNLEHENIKYAKENLMVQQARFRVGVATTLESRQAENDYTSALIRLYTAAYNLKVNETQVLELENRLVK